MSWKANPLENNGALHRFEQPWAHDLRTMDRVVIRCRGNGPFKLTLETSNAGGCLMPTLRSALEEWQDVVLDDFSWSQAQWRPQSVTPSRELEDVLRVGLMKYMVRPGRLT